MNPVDITNKYPRSDLSYQIKQQIDFKSAYELCLKDIGKKPTINVLRRYLIDNNLKVDEKSFFDFLQKKSKPAYKTNKFKLLAALFLIFGTSIFLFANTSNFYADKTFINDLKKEYIAVKVPKNFISCETGKKLSDKAEYYDMRDEYLHKRYSLNKNSIGNHKILVISNLLENTRVEDSKRVFCIREKPMRQIEIEQFLSEDKKWRYQK